MMTVVESFAVPLVQPRWLANGRIEVGPRTKEALEASLFTEATVTVFVKNRAYG
jgi:hypothetical protein